MNNFFLIISLFLMPVSADLLAEDPSTKEPPAALDTLTDLLKSRDSLEERIAAKAKKIDTSNTEEAVKRLENELESLNKQLNNLLNRFERIATGIDITIIKQTDDASEGLGADFQLLLEPLLKSAKHATIGMREKAELQDQISNYQKILPKVALAVGNLSNLLSENDLPGVSNQLNELHTNWKQQLDLIASDLAAAQQQLTIMQQNESGLAESIQTSTKHFFQTRGRYFIEGLLAFFAVLLISRLIYRLSIKLFPILKQPGRNFKIRFLDLVYRVLSLIAAILAPMAIFYIVEDWVLFSIGILILFAITWSLRTLIPRFWDQGRLLLNIGSVRENERLEYGGIPWLVKNINIFTKIENPTSGLRLRLPIGELSQLASRPVLKNEPWFPCKKGDWVLLDNDFFGRVVGLSVELVELIDRGSCHKTMTTVDFIAKNPLNLSVGFRHRIVLGLDYSHQQEITSVIPDLLETFILEKIADEGFADLTHRIQVQFSEAADSSLNIIILADFKGDAAPQYRKLQRAIRQWAVEASTQYGWSIPFPQMTIHQKQ